MSQEVNEIGRPTLSSVVRQTRVITSILQVSINSALSGAGGLTFHPAPATLPSAAKLKGNSAGEWIFITKAKEVKSHSQWISTQLWPGLEEKIGESREYKQNYNFFLFLSMPNTHTLPSLKFKLSENRASLLHALSAGSLAQSGRSANSGWIVNELCCLT